MSEKILSLLIKDSKNYTNSKVREKYNILFSVIGIIFNMVLFVVKLIIGSALSSVSITVDAFNNLTDAISNIIGFIGVKLSVKPADEEHPFGHGRIEYIAALIITFLILEVGFSFVKESIRKIISPENISFELVPIIILLITMMIKLWISIINKKWGNKIDSDLMRATSIDAMGDVVITFGTVVSLIVFKITNINIDGYVGVLIAIIIMYSGIQVARETLSPLIGEKINKEQYYQIKKIINSYEGVQDSHDLIIHNYGPNKGMASVHVELPNKMGMIKSHSLIEKIEAEVIQNTGVYLVIHIDPVDCDFEKKNEIKIFLYEILRIDPRLSFHDLRFINKKGKKTAIMFELTVPFNYTDKEKKYIESYINREIKKINKNYICVISYEHSYV